MCFAFFVDFLILFLPFFFFVHVLLSYSCRSVRSYPCSFFSSAASVHFFLGGGVCLSCDHGCTDRWGISWNETFNKKKSSINHWGHYFSSWAARRGEVEWKIQVAKSSGSIITGSNETQRANRVYKSTQRCCFVWAPRHDHPPEGMSNRQDFALQGACFLSRCCLLVCSFVCFRLFRPDKTWSQLAAWDKILQQRLFILISGLKRCHSDRAA